MIFIFDRRTCAADSRFENVTLARSISIKGWCRSRGCTVAVRVTKAKADHVVICGHDGGTGRPRRLSSLKHAGNTLELGLADNQQTLVLEQKKDCAAGISGDKPMPNEKRPRYRHCGHAARTKSFCTAPLVVEGCYYVA